MTGNTAHMSLTQSVLKIETDLEQRHFLFGTIAEASQAGSHIRQILDFPGRSQTPVHLVSPVAKNISTLQVNSLKILSLWGAKIAWRERACSSALSKQIFS